MLRGWLKHTLLRHGYLVQRLPRFQQLLRLELLSNRPFVFVQVGANDGVAFDDLFWFVTANNATGLVIEPLSDMFERLCYNYRGYPAIKPIRVAVHPKASSVVLHRVRPDLLDSLPDWVAGSASIDLDWLRKAGLMEDVTIEEIAPAVHLMSLLDEHSITSLSLLQIDTEGFDAEVVRMLDFRIVRPRIIKYESRQEYGEDEALPILQSVGL